MVFWKSYCVAFARFVFWLASFLLVSELWAFDELGPRQDLFKIDDIEVIGVKKVEKEAVFERIGSRKGMLLDNYLLRKDLEKIYGLKYFEWVEAHKIERGNKKILQFRVQEKPIITKITFRNNQEIDNDDLKSSIKSKDFSILDINTIKNDVLVLQKQYEEKGFFLAKIDYQVKKTNDENVEVLFDIQEFDKVRVKKITFLGNKAFLDEQLKEIMEIREESLFSFMTGAGNFKEFNFQTDIERIKFFYKTKGHLQANIGAPEVTISEDKKWIFITLKINEGPIFTVNNISFDGEILFPENELMEKIKLQNNDTYSETLLREDIQMLTEMYQDEGYAFANVLRTLRILPGENKVDVDFSFEKGEIAYFGKIIVKGNTKTRDKVIRRELLIREGSRFSGSNLRRSKENVNRLGFFEPNSIIFNTISSKEKNNVLDVEIQVKERNTGQISLGSGFSTASGFFFNASIAQNNFRGLGQNLAFSLTLSDTTKNFNLGFTEPYLFDTKWTAGGDLFKTENTASDAFSYKKKGLDVHLGYPIFEYTKLFGTYKLEETEVSAKDDPTINEEVENGVASSFKLTIVRDLRDNKFEPSKGHYISLGSEYAGIGFDKKWWKNELDVRYFRSIWEDLILRARMFGSKLEVVDGTPIPRSERFALGGARNLRGFDYEAVGPKSLATFSDGTSREFNTRGLFVTFTTLEFEHPLAREAGLKWVVFADMGHAGDHKHIKFHKDYGFGLRWFSPIGVLRFELGYPIGKEADGEDDHQFHFDLGQLF